MFQKKERKLAADQLKTYALKLIGGRSLSIGELREKLRKKAEKPDDVIAVIETLRELKFLDDRRFAENFAAVRRDSRGLGRQRALSDLLKKRVAPGLATQAIDQAYAEVDEVQMIEAYLARKYRNKDLGQTLKEPRELASVFRRLRGAGFSTGNTIRVLKRFAAQAVELEDLEEPGSAI